MSKNRSKKVRVLFVDDKNDLASQIAEYYARQMFSDMYEVYSAGPEHDIIDCDLISVMYRAGEDIRHQISKDFGSADLPKDGEYDIVVYMQKSVFDRWSQKTHWKGKQIIQDMGSRADFKATDDVELDECLTEMVGRIKDWIKATMSDPDKLMALVVA
jgi:arsenate reductase (thioredoxin)